MQGSLDFSHAEVQRAAAYHRARYLALAGRLVLSAVVLGALAWALPRWDPCAGLGWAGAAAAYAALVVLAQAVVHAPLEVAVGWRRERRWGFSKQPLGAWLGDQGKALGLSVAFAAAAWTALVGLARTWPGAWPLAAGVLVALTVLVLSFVAPVLLEPLFSRFEPLGDERLAGELRALAERAGVPVRDVLVADASRRTTKLNAYVSGLGRTRRVVLFDTLLESADEREVRLVVAHELGHRRHGDVAKGTVLGMLAAAGAVAVVWAVLGTRVASPAEVAAASLLGLALQLAGMAPGAAFSRRLERAADRFSLELTGDLEAFERAHLALARRNLSDVAPPRLVYLALFTHPTAPQRLAAARAWAAAHARA